MRILLKKKNIFILTMAMGIFLTGCGIKSEVYSESGNNLAEKTTAHAISMAGSTSMEKFANAASELYMQKEQDITVTTEFIGSSAGIESLLSGMADIGNASRELKDSEKQAGAVENIVALDGIAVILDVNNPVHDLSKSDLVDIYTGKKNNWSSFGGENRPIVVVGREMGSGTRGAFEELLDIEEKGEYSNELDSSGAVMAKVASIEGAIGYVSIDVINNSVQVAAIEGIPATAENIKSGRYFLCRPFVMATRGDITKQSKAIQDFFHFLYSEEGDKLIQSVGLIPVQK